MKVLELRAENFQRLKAVRIRPDGSLVVIAGQNAQGKTSVLDAIVAALVGSAASKIKKPIRDGARKAEILLDLGDIVIERTWTAAGSKLIVRTADGTQYPSPQKFLDSLVGRLWLDPLAFANSKPKEQVETLLGVLDLPFDLTAMEAKRDSIFTRRTDVNRENKSLTARLDGLPPERGLKIEQVDIVALSNVLQEIRSADRRRREAREEYDRLNAEIERLVELREEAKARGLAATTEHVSLVGHHGTPEEVETKINFAREINEAVLVERERQDLKNRLADGHDLAASLSEQLKEIDERKAAGLREANLPYPGLGFDADGVTLNGVPFEQASGAERLKVSVAIAFRLNPEIKVIRITDGSLLDQDSLRALKDMIPEDAQVWIERVGNADGMGFVISDGEIQEEGAS